MILDAVADQVSHISDFFLQLSCLQTDIFL